MRNILYSFSIFVSILVLSNQIQTFVFGLRNILLPTSDKFVFLFWFENGLRNIYIYKSPVPRPSRGGTFSSPREGVLDVFNDNFNDNFQKLLDSKSDTDFLYLV